ncbi:hypothetical protein ABPG73_006049 [Tetrahymena malaccensis]
MQESERQEEIESSPSSFYLKQQQGQINSQNNMQNYDSLLYSEITENNQTLLNTPQHPFKQKNPLGSVSLSFNSINFQSMLKNTQQMESGQVSERLNIQSGDKNQVSNYNQNINNSQKNSQQQQTNLLSSNDKKHQQSSQQISQNQSSRNNKSNDQNVVFQYQGKSPYKINEFQICTEEDETENKEEAKQDIEKIDLSGNMLQKIQNLNSFKSLVYLNLSYNRIQVIENIEMLVNLQYLNLSNNNIKEIPSSIERNAQIQHLLLSSNNISSINSIVSLQKLLNLKELNLLDNPIQQCHDYKNYVKNNLKQILLLDQKNLHVSNLNSVGESWNSQLSFSNNTVNQSAHFQKKPNCKLQQQAQFHQQNNLVQPIQGLLESFSNNNNNNNNSTNQNRQNHIYSFGSQQNDTPTNHLFGFEINMDNPHKLKKPQSLDFQYLTSQNQESSPQQIRNYFNADLNRSITEIETEFDSDGNVLDKQFQEQRIFYSNAKSSKKNFKAFLEFQNQLQLQQQYLASPLNNEQSVILFENMNSSDKHNKSVWQNNTQERNEQTFSESANKNSFLMQSKNQQQREGNQAENDLQNSFNFKKDKKFETQSQVQNLQNQFNQIQSSDQNLIHSKTLRRNLAFDEQVGNNFLPHLSEEEAYRLKKCLFQQNNDKIQYLSNQQFSHHKQEEENTNNKKKERINDDIFEEVNLTNIHSISNYVYDESTAKKSNQQINFIQSQKNQQQLLPPPPLPINSLKEDQAQINKDKFKTSPFQDQIGVNNSEYKLNEQEQNGNHLNNVSQLQSLFDNIESHRGDFLIQDFSQIYASKVNTSDVLGVQFTPQNHNSNNNNNLTEFVSPTEESTINSNILNSEKQCQSVANTLNILNSQLKALHESFQEYNTNLDQTADRSNQLIQKIIKCTEENLRDQIKEKEKLVQDIQIFKGLVSSSFEQINVFVEEFGFQINTFMKTIQECSESKCDQLNNEGIIPKISTNTLNDINEIFEKIQTNNNQLFINANKMTEEINRAKNIQNDFLVEKLNQNIEKIISLFKEVSNLHLTCCDTFESIQHTSERLTKFFIHIVRLFQAKQAIQFSNHKRNLSNQTNNSQNQTIQMKPQSSSNNTSKDQGQANSKLNRQQSSKDFNIQNNNNNNNSFQFQINDKDKKAINTGASNQYNQHFQQIQNQISNRDSQKQESFDKTLDKQEDLITPKSNNNNLNTNMNSNNSRMALTPLQEGFIDEEQKKLMNSNIEQIQQQMNNYRKEIQQKHLKNQKSEELKLEELNPSQRINLLQQNINNANIFPLPTQYMNQQQPNINTSMNSDVQVKSNIPLSPLLTTNSPNANLNQLKHSSQKPTQYQQELEILRFKFSDFEKTSLMRYDNLLKAKEQVEKDYNQIVQNYSELQQNYESILVKYSGLQSKYEESLSMRDRNNNEIEREELISQISQLKLRVNDLEKFVGSSENQKQLLLKDKQILKEQLSLVQKDYESLEKQNQININQNQKLIDNNKDLSQQNQQLLLRLTEAENTVLSMKQVLTPRLPSQQQSDQLQEYTSNQERQYSHKKSLSQQLNNQYNNNQITTQQQQGQNQLIFNEDLSNLLKNMLQNVNTNMQQNTQIIQLLGSKDTIINNQIQSDNQNENQYESHQEWSEMLKMQIKQKQLLYKQIQTLAAIITTVQLNDETKLQECIKKITSLQETTNQSTQTDLNSLANTQYQFFDSIISPPSKTSTVITQQTNNNNNNNNISNNLSNNQNNNHTATIHNNNLEDSNTKSNIMTATTMTLPNILESVRKHQHNMMQAKLKNNTTVNSSSTASEKLYKLAAQRYEEETNKNLKHKKTSNQPCDKWFNNSPERYCGQQNSKTNQNEEKIDEINQSSSQNSSSTQNKSLQKSRQLLKQMTDLANDKKQFLAEDSAFLQTKKKVANNDFKQGDQSTSSGNKKNVSKLLNDLHNHMDKKTFRNASSINSNQTNAQNINQSDTILNNTTTNKKSKREQTKSPSAQSLTKNSQQNIILSNHNSNNSQQILVNNFLKKEFKYPSKGSQSSLLNQSHHLTNKTQQSQNQSSSVLHLTQINSNSNNPNNASNVSHYKSNSNIIDRVSLEHSKKQKNCLKSVIKAYKNIETLRKMQDILKNEDNFTAFLNKTTTNIHINQSFNNNHHSHIPTNQFNINHQNNQNNNVIENCTNNQITKILKKVTRSQSNLSTQNGQKAINSITHIHPDANTKRDKSKE